MSLDFTDVYFCPSAFKDCTGLTEVIFLGPVTIIAHMSAI